MEGAAERVTDGAGVRQRMGAPQRGRRRWLTYYRSVPTRQAHPADAAPGCYLAVSMPLSPECVGLGVGAGVGWGGGSAHLWARREAASTKSGTENKEKGEGAVSGWSEVHSSEQRGTHGWIDISR